MKSDLQSIFRTYRSFLIPATLFFLISGIVLLAFPKAGIHLFINQYHSFVSDRLFVFLTFCGSGISAFISLAILLFVSYRSALYLLTSYSVSSIVVQLLKRLIFYETERPLSFFKNSHELYLVPGVDMNLYHSFPSGHSATAFALCFCLAVLFQRNFRKDYGIYLGIIAILIAFSRVYLSQHFLVDIYFGSLIGLIAVILFYKPFILSEKAWLDKSLLSLFARD